MTQTRERLTEALRRNTGTNRLLVMVDRSSQRGMYLDRVTQLSENRVQLEVLEVMCWPRSWLDEGEGQWHAEHPLEEGDLFEVPLAPADSFLFVEEEALTHRLDYEASVYIALREARAQAIREDYEPKNAQGRRVWARRCRELEQSIEDIVEAIDLQEGHELGSRGLQRLSPFHLSHALTNGVLLEIAAEPAARTTEGRDLFPYTLLEARRDPTTPTSFAQRGGLLLPPQCDLPGDLYERRGPHLVYGSIIELWYSIQWDSRSFLWYPAL